MSENEKENPQPWAPSTLQDVGWLVSGLRDIERRRAEFKAAVVEMDRRCDIEKRRLESFLPLCEPIIRAALPHGRKSVIYAGHEGAFTLKLTASKGGLKVTDKEALVSALVSGKHADGLRVTYSTTVYGEDALELVNALDRKPEPVMSYVDELAKGGQILPGCVIEGPHERVGWSEIKSEPSDAD